jgi:hypothetical protein
VTGKFLEPRETFVARTRRLSALVFARAWLPTASALLGAAAAIAHATTPGLAPWVTAAAVLIAAAGKLLPVTLPTGEIRAAQRHDSGPRDRLHRVFTFVYAGGVPDETYMFTDETYLALAKARVSPLAVTDVLYGDWRVRRHIGASLQIAGQDRDGGWLAVALVETDDDQYIVTGARYLDEDEIAAISRMRGEQS